MFFFENILARSENIVLPVRWPVQVANVEGKCLESSRYQGQRKVPTRLRVMSTHLFVASF